VLTEIKNRGVADVCIVVCDGLQGLPETITTVWERAIVQTSSIDTVRWRDGPAGHRATRGGPMQTSAFEAHMQTCPSGWERAA
jgi:mutator family transposase